MKPPPKLPPRPVAQHEPAQGDPPPEVMTLDLIAGLVRRGIANGAVSAAHAARAGATASRVESQVNELTRTALDDQGRPGLLPWMANEIVALRALAHSPSPKRMYYTSAVTAAVVTGGILLLAHFGLV